MIKCVVFDLFGTLVQIQDKRHPYRKLIHRSMFSAPLTFNWLFVNRYRKMAMRQDLTFKEFARTMCNGKLPFLYNETLMDLQQELSSIQTLPGAIELIQYLKANGVRVGVCSNLAHEYKVALELLPEFDFQVLSFEERCQKPQREIYERVIAYSECTPDEILFVGDSHQNDFLSPIKYGMDAVHLNMKEWVDRAVISHVRTRYGAAIVRDPEHYHLLFAEYHDNGPRSSS